MFFDSRRSAVLARNGMVATSQPLAAVAGLRIMMQGGNAVDAAVATAAVLNVVEPESTGIGGDMFALVRPASDRKVYALNGSGRAPAAAVTTVLAASGYPGPPRKGDAISIPPELQAAEDVRLFHAGTRLDGGRLVTDGGRVMAVTAVAPDTATAAARSRDAAEAIRFDGKQFRRDIAWRELARHARTA